MGTNANKLQAARARLEAAEQHSQRPKDLGGMWVTRKGLGVVVALVVLALALALLCGQVFAQEVQTVAQGSKHTHEQSPAIPGAARQYRALLVRSAHYGLGLQAPVAMLAAQVQTESWWRVNTVSAVGAQGLTQFMPATARWIATLDKNLAVVEPFNPAWSLRAMAVYDAYLLNRVQGATACDQWAKALSAYNGGLKWVGRDEGLARRNGLDASRWWGHVATVNSGRKASAYKENRTYVQRILHVIAPAYVQAGWGSSPCL